MSEIIKVNTMPFNPIAKYTFAAKPKKSMAYIKVLEYILYHPMCSIGDIIPNALGKEMREYHYPNRAKGLPLVERHWPSNSILPALRSAGLIVAYRVTGEGKLYRYEISADGIALLNTIE